MPKRRPLPFLKRLGARMRARRLEVNRSTETVARMVEISTQQLWNYESGTGHPPAATLHRIAMALGTSSSDLLGETIPDTMAGQFDALARLYNDPMIGAVTREMQEMTVVQRRMVQALTATVRAAMPKPAQTAEVMK